MLLVDSGCPIDVLDSVVECRCILLGVGADPTLPTPSGSALPEHTSIHSRKVCTLTSAASLANLLDRCPLEPFGVVLSQAFGRH